MDYIQLALFAEGPSDHEFLAPLLRRAVESKLGDHATRVVEVGPVRALPRVDGAGLGRTERVEQAVRADQAQFHILFLHADGNGDRTRALAQRVTPSIAPVEDAHDGRRVVGVVPARMTEAWALCDGEALREVLSTTLDDIALGLPQDPERNLDPKATLDEAVRRARPRRKSRRRDAGRAYLELLGETIRIDELRRLPSFDEFRNELLRALVALGYIPGSVFDR